jgi:hypothetical protein
MRFSKVIGWLQIITGFFISAYFLLDILIGHESLISQPSMADIVIGSLYGQVQIIEFLILIISIMIFLQGIINLKKKD